MSEYGLLDTLYLMTELDKLAQADPLTPGQELPMTGPADLSPERVRSLALQYLNALVGTDATHQSAPAASGQPTAGQSGQAQPQPTAQTAISMPLPFDGSTIDFERIQQWLQAFLTASGAGVQLAVGQAAARQASNNLDWLTHASTTGASPLPLDQSLDTLYRNVKARFAANPQQAVEMPNMYLSKLLDLVNNLVSALRAFQSHGYPADRMDDLNQQYQLAQRARIQIGMWQDSLPGAQRRVDGR